ncbi:MAG: hypothetical protein LCH86_22850 [Proteobacteria bacterium]|jgi:hypothetical protein|uniref:hypothetical protein n=1 Tax=Hyphomicrobiales TaxID=356 RepID=UPI00035D77D6|nr:MULTISPECIES: hypothetical protein [Phyllobacteriaceae]MCA0278844.1 hypothetical protein [Pseudomonadota bacterium]MCX8571753.1 hypothetical protein [Aminobacter sp. MET-1]
MREVTTPPTPTPAGPAISLPQEASAAEVADFARGTAILDRLARRVAELLAEHDKGVGR